MFGFLRRRREPFSGMPEAGAARPPQIQQIMSRAESSKASESVEAYNKVVPESLLLSRLEQMEKSIKDHITAETGKVSSGMAETFATELRRLTAEMQGLPEKTKKEIEPLLVQLPKARTPLAVKTVTEEITKKVSLALGDMIDTAIINIVAEKGRLTTTDLLKAVNERGVCSRASFFRHVKQLETRNRLRKVSEGKGIYYTIAGSETQSQQGLIVPEISGDKSDTDNAKNG